MYHNMLDVWLLAINKNIYMKPNHCEFCAGLPKPVNVMVTETTNVSISLSWSYPPPPVVDIISNFLVNNCIIGQTVTSQAFQSTCLYESDSNAYIIHSRLHTQLMRNGEATVATLFNLNMQERQGSMAQALHSLLSYQAQTTNLKYRPSLCGEEEKRLLDLEMF